MDLVEAFRNAKQKTGLSTAQLAKETGITARAGAALLSGKVEGFRYPIDLEKRIRAAVILFADFSTFAESDFQGRAVGSVVRPCRRDGSPMYSDPRNVPAQKDFSLSYSSIGKVEKTATGKIRRFKLVDGKLVRVN